MRLLKKEKIGEILHRLAAEFVRDESSPASLITITRVDLTPSGKDAYIYFTTLPEDKQETAQKFLDRKIIDFKRYVYDNGRIGLVPHLAFKIDHGERNRQRIDELSGEILKEEEKR